MTPWHRICAALWLALAAGAVPAQDLTEAERLRAEAQERLEAIELPAPPPAPGTGEILVDMGDLWRDFYATPPADPKSPGSEAYRAAVTEVLTDSYAPAVAALYAYHAQSFDHRRRVFEWQLVSSKVIFGVVIGLVLAGLYFSWLQFRQAMTQAATLPRGEEMTGSGTNTSFEVSENGLKVTSNVLGVIILALSLAFFYLYLKYVYGIQEIL